jgi:hypothetical protein
MEDKELKEEQDKRDKEKIEDEKDPKKWKENRAANYPSLQEQLEKIADDGIDKRKTEMLDPIKQKFPKS